MAFNAKKSSKTTYRSLLRFCVIALLWFSAITIIMVLPLRWINPITSSFIIRDIVKTGEPVYKASISLDEMGISAPMAIIASEDQKFANHFGLDFSSLYNAASSRLNGVEAGGGSTITQQLAKNLWLWSEKSYVRKILEAWYTLWLEILLPKGRILELYLNYAEFGNRNYGIEAASTHYYGIPSAELTASQAALLAASLPNPKKLDVNNPSTKMRKRARWIERQMRQLGGARYLDKL